MFGVKYINTLNLSQDFLFPVLFDKTYSIVLAHPTEETSQNDQIDTCTNASSSLSFDGKWKRKHDMKVIHV